MKIDFSKEQLLAVYRSGGNEARKAIKEALGDEHPSVKAWRSLKYGYSVSDTDPETADLIAYAVLRVITDALNEGWRPQFTKGERRWYAWFGLVTPDEIEEMNEEDKCGVVGRASYGTHAYGGLVYSGAHNVSSYSYTYYGSRLAFKNEELAEYAAKQFGELYAEFCFIPKAACKNDKN